MNFNSYKAKLESNPMLYDIQYNNFWKRKIEIEACSTGHILDDNHRDDTCKKLLEILPGWQTYRGVQCDYATWLPISLANIADAYNQIRNYDLLNLNKIHNKPLKLIWHELGRVKTKFGKRNKTGDYSIISVCKPLMLLWGQTPPFDSIPRRNLSLSILGSSWDFGCWKVALQGLQKELLKNPNVTKYCRKKAIKIYNSAYIIPYGRFLDIYYY